MYLDHISVDILLLFLTVSCFVQSPFMYRLVGMSQLQVRGSHGCHYGKLSLWLLFQCIHHCFRLGWNDHGILEPRLFKVLATRECINNIFLHLCIVGPCCLCNFLYSVCVKLQLLCRWEGGMLNILNANYSKLGQSLPTLLCIQEVRLDLMS